MTRSYSTGLKHKMNRFVLYVNNSYNETFDSTELAVHAT